MKYLIISLLLAILLPAIAIAHDFEVDGIYYESNGNKATVTYRGSSCSSYHNEYSGDVVIPEFVTYNGVAYNVVSIGTYAFWDCNELNSVVIPNSVTSIGRYAFSYCYKLTSVSIPNSVLSIGDYVFDCCYSLTSIIIPNSVTSIPTWAFNGCTSLSNVIIPNSVTSIGIRAFGSCEKLESINLPNSTNIINSLAFEGCSGLTSLTIPNSVTTIGEKAFIGCTGLSSIIVENGNHYFDSREDCNAIIETASNTLIVGCSRSNIPNTVTGIGSYAFMHSDWGSKMVIIPNSVTSIGEQAFYGCINLKNVLIPSSVKQIGNEAFKFNSINSIIICGNIETVGNDIFSSVSSLYINSEVSRLPNLGFSPSNIYCYPPIPPTCQGGTFSAYTGALHVPATSIAAYFTAPIWENFDNMMGDAVEPLSVNLNQNDLEIPLRETTLLTATILPNNAYPNTITWSSSNTDIATVDNGTVTAISVGECDIIATCLDIQAICHVVVKDATITITLDHNEAQVLPNHIITLIPAASSDVLPELAVSSSEPSIASARVSNGIIRIVGIKEGTTTIAVGSVDGNAVPATCLVTVYTEAGDLNCDGFTNINDVTQIIDYLLSGDASNIKLGNADVNADSNINISDVTTLIDKLLSTN